MGWVPVRGSKINNAKQPRTFCTRHFDLGDQEHAHPRIKRASLPTRAQGGFFALYTKRLSLSLSSAPIVGCTPYHSDEEGKYELYIVGWQTRAHVGPSILELPLMRTICVARYCWRQSSLFHVLLDETNCPQFPQAN